MIYRAAMSRNKELASELLEAHIDVTLTTVAKFSA